MLVVAEACFIWMGLGAGPGPSVPEVAWCLVESFLVRGWSSPAWPSRPVGWISPHWDVRSAPPGLLATHRPIRLVGHPGEGATIAGCSLC